MVSVASHELQPNHVYRIHARIYNGSLEAPAVGLPVFFSYLTFGIGIVPTLIGVTAINLPVKGAMGHPQEAFHDWRTPPAAGHYCIQVGLFWADDIEPGNNIGQENVDVKKLTSPATFQFALRNDAPVTRRFRLEIDAYTPPALPPCPEQRVAERGDSSVAPARDPSTGAAPSRRSSARSPSAAAQLDRGFLAGRRDCPARRRTDRHRRGRECARNIAGSAAHQRERIRRRRAGRRRHSLRA